MHRFGPAHLTLLATVALGSAAAAAFGRRLRGRADASPFTRSLAYVIVGAMIADPIVRRAYGELTLARALPLQLCDAAAAICAAALWTRRQLPFELAYFWGLAGVTQAMLTPPGSLPGADDPDTWRYFVVHGAAIAGVFHLLGMGFRPRRGAWRRATLLTMTYAAAVGAIDAALGANYMWLREKPEGSVLDLFGPWPWYILGGTAVGAALFYVLELSSGVGGGAGEGGGAAAPGAP
ncbi:MAG TPA: TIGR02206 family membrane protein [Planctomycetota bacterium]|nr:TIGR02206 family membrane protein [Planctomycetota bacterium]